MSFAAPYWLWALLLLPLAVAVELWCAKHDRERTSALVARALWGRMVERAPRPLRWVRLGLVLLGMAGVILALARPEWGVVREKVEREGVDVVLLLDTSASMQTEDVAPNRFALAKLALLSLVRRLDGNRFALVAFEGEAYPLVPLTLDTDAIALFLETAEPGIVPAPGSSVGEGLARGLTVFADKDRKNKAMVLVSDGENLEGEVAEAAAAAKKAGVVVHTVGVGTLAGAPVPELDENGHQTGYKHDANGRVVVSQLHPETLQAISKATGGKYVELQALDPSLSEIASAIEGMDRKGMAEDYTYKNQERYQLPLAVGVVALLLALLLPVVPSRRLRLRAGAAVVVAGTLLLGGGAGPATAQDSSQSSSAPQPIPPVILPPQGGSPQGLPPATRPLPPQHPQGAQLQGSQTQAPQGAAPAPPPPPDLSKGRALLGELTLEPRRKNSEGRHEFELGNHPKALEAFQKARAARPNDPRIGFNLGDALYKSARYDDAAKVFGQLAESGPAGLRDDARFNLGNTLFQKQDYKGAVSAYRQVLESRSEDEAAKRNLELALRALAEQKRQQQQQQQDQKDQKNQKKDEQKQQQQGSKDQKDQQKQQQQQQQQEQQKQQQAQQQQAQQQPQRPMTKEEKEEQRFKKETGMPKERAIQLLQALQENEKAEQRRLLEQQRQQAKGDKDW